MKLLLLCLFVAVAHAGLAPLHMAKTRGIPNSFVIKIKDAAQVGLVADEVLSRFAKMRTPTPKINKIVDLLPVLTLRIPSHLVNEVRSIDGIEYIEQDVMGELFGSQINPTWGIDRIDQRTSIDYVFNYNDNVQGAGVSIYIVDTGIQLSHNVFGGRATQLYGGNDDHGHGTHCAGTAGGDIYGIARQATVYGVKVCNKYGQCPTSTLLDGLNQVLGSGAGVVSMSLGFPPTSSVDSGVQSLLNSGFVVSVSAGNSNSDACNNSPARVPGAITVAASDSWDNRAYFSCYGSCVDIFAPGVRILSAEFSTSDNNGSTTMSGTSMACPHVTGAAALYFGKGMSSQAVVNQMLIDATPNVIYDAQGSPNRLLYVNH